MAGLQALLTAQRHPKPSAPTQEGPLLQALKSLVTKAQNQADFDLWNGLQSLVNAETQKRQSQGNQPKNANTSRSAQPRSWGQPWQGQETALKNKHSTNRQSGSQLDGGWTQVMWKPRPQDWHSELTDSIVIAFGPHQYSDALDDPANRDAAFLAVAQNLDELCELIELTKGERSAMATLLLPSAIAPPDDDEMRTTLKVPGTLR